MRRRDFIAGLGASAWPLAAHAQQPKADNIPQQVVLYEEDPRDGASKSYVGSAVWRTEVVPPGRGEKPNIAARVDIEIPAENISIRWSLRRNDDKRLPASHIIEIVFTLPPDFRHGGIYLTGLTTLRVPLDGVVVKATNNSFLIGLSLVGPSMQRNIQLLIDGSWFEIHMFYGDRKRATISIEKGTPGERAFMDALGH